jgi:hypothetical protein
MYKTTIVEPFRVLIVISKELAIYTLILPYGNNKWLSFVSTERRRLHSQRELNYRMQLMDIPIRSFFLLAAA